MRRNDNAESDAALIFETHSGTFVRRQEAIKMALGGLSADDSLRQWVFLLNVRSKLFAPRGSNERGHLKKRTNSTSLNFTIARTHSALLRNCVHPGYNISVQMHVFLKGHFVEMFPT